MADVSRKFILLRRLIAILLPVIALAGIAIVVADLANAPADKTIPSPF